MANEPDASASGDPATGRVRVAYTLEQCWHDSPGGTAVAALRIADELEAMDDVELLQVAGRHPTPPQAEFRPRGSVAMLPLARPLLYESWTRLNWPKVEAVTGPIDVAHATGLVPAATSAPLVVTVHDLAFVRHPEMFSRHGVRLMNRSLGTIRKRADRVLCSSRATIDDCVAAGIDPDRLRLVPLGVDTTPADGADIRRVRRQYDLPDEFVLFVGTIEPRKNLRRLVAAAERVGSELVVAGADGWGDVDVSDHAGVRFIGFVPGDRLGALYAAATVFAYPSEWEGYGLPVAEAMAQGAAVVTSRDTAMADVVGGAGVLIDPHDVGDIGRGLVEARDRRAELGQAARERAAELTWRRSAEATLTVYRELIP